MKYLGFPVTFGYMEKTVLSGGRQYTHRGIDLGSWVGDRLVIQGKNVAITGDTGLVEGPHTHVQAGRDEWAQATINPAPYIGKPGRVVKVGYANEWGNYVAIRVGDVNVFYCHLQRVTVSVGDEISNLVASEKGETMVNNHQLNVIYRFRLGRTPDAAAKKSYIGKGFDFVDADVRNSKEYKDRISNIHKTKEVSTANLDAGARDAMGSAILVKKGSQQSPSIVTKLKKGFYEV